MRRQRGKCAVCGLSSALRNDGRVYRHFAGLHPADRYGNCAGWGELPVGS